MDKNKMIIGVVVLVAVGVVIYMMQGGETNYGEAKTAEACGELEGSHWEASEATCVDKDGNAVADWKAADDADGATCKETDGNVYTPAGGECHDKVKWDRGVALAAADTKEKCDELTGSWADAAPGSCADADGTANDTVEAECVDPLVWSPATAASCTEPVSEEVAND